MFERKWRRTILKLEIKSCVFQHLESFDVNTWREVDVVSIYIYIYHTHQVCPKSKDWKTKQFKSLSIKKAKEPKASLNKKLLFLWPYIRGCHWISLLDHLVKDQVRFWYQCPFSIVWKKDALNSHPQVIKFTSCLPRVGGSLRVLRLPPPLKVVAMI